MGIEAGFDAPHERQLGRILELGQVRPLLRSPDAVLTGYGPAQADPGRDDVVQDGVANGRIGLPHRQVHIPVGSVPATDHQ